MHGILGHHEKGDDCDFDSAHIHEEGHHHFSCAVCLYHFSPTDLEEFELNVKQPKQLSSSVLIDFERVLIPRQTLQSRLRGPPIDQSFCI